MTPFEYLVSTRRYNDDYNSRSDFERWVVDLRRDWCHFVCLVTMPGLTLIQHLPAGASRWLIGQIQSGKWWLIGPEAWWTRAINGIKDLRRK